MFLEYK